jgi:hypothetical protein
VLQCEDTANRVVAVRLCDLNDNSSTTAGACKETGRCSAQCNQSCFRDGIELKQSYIVFDRFYDAVHFAG